MGATPESGPVAQVAFDRLEFGAAQAAAIAAGAEQGFDAMPARDQFVHQVGADKPRGSGNEAFHSCLPLGGAGGPAEGWPARRANPPSPPTC
jgi:hypothetical protein